MKVLSTEGLTKLIELIKSAFISVDDTVSTNSVTLATVATSGSYNDLSNKPTIPTTTTSITSGSTAALTSGGAYTNLVTKVEAGSTANIIKVTKAGSASNITINNVAHATAADSATSATSAITASKLGSTTVGGATNPIYLNNGTPTPLDYTLDKSVPPDAVFTDTTYSNFVKSGTGAAAGLVPAPSTTAGTSKYLCENATWTTPPDTKNTTGGDNTSSKIFLVGMTSQTSSNGTSRTYTHDTAFVDANGRLNSAAPASGANDTTVATTKWVKDQGYTSNTGTVTSVNNVNPVNGNVTLNIPSEVTESTVSGWGFTKNAGTVTKVNNTSPDANGNVTLSIPTVPLEGVQINGTDLTITSKKVNIPLAGTDTIGVAKANAAYGVYNNNGSLTISKATDTQVTGKTSQYRPLTPYNIDLAVKTGITTNTLTLTDKERNTACSWLGAARTSVQTLQSITSVTYAASQTITLTANSSIYKLAPTGNITSMTFSLAASEGASATTAYTFELYLDMSSTLRTVAFPASSILTWQNGEAPDLSETGVYLFAFRTLDGGSHWIGNLQGKW